MGVSMEAATRLLTNAELEEEAACDRSGGSRICFCVKCQAFVAGSQQKVRSAGCWKSQSDPHHGYTVPNNVFSAMKEYGGKWLRKVPGLENSDLEVDDE